MFRKSYCQSALIWKTFLVFVDLLLVLFKLNSDTFIVNGRFSDLHVALGFVPPEVPVFEGALLRLVNNMGRVSFQRVSILLDHELFSVVG